MEIRYATRFDKKFKRAPVRIQRATVRRIKLFRENRQHALLNRHKLKGKYNNCWSINVTGDWRAIYREVNGAIEWIEFIELGTHSELYK